MYRSNDMWEEAIRWQSCTGRKCFETCCVRVGPALGGEAGAVLQNLVSRAAIDYAMESGAFDHAFELARSSLQRKLPDIHLKHALFLEDEEKYTEAEEEFINANKPREAIDMYVHQQDWSNAHRVASSFDPAAVPDVYIAEARACADRHEYPHAEELFLAASKPELASRCIRRRRCGTSHALAQQIAAQGPEVNTAYQSAQATKGTGGTKGDFLKMGGCGKSRSSGRMLSMPI